MNFPGARPAVRHRLRVLVVDDNRDYREILLAILDTDELLVVGEAASGQDSIDLVSELQPDIVLMDVRMPGMNGVETTRRLKELHPGVEVVALTADAETTAVRDMLAAGASGYVLKDADGRNIVEAVRTAARNGGVLSPGVAPTVIDELNEALGRERRRSEELQEAHDQLVERISQRHDLVSRLGHELRTPVSVIFGVARTLASGGLDEAEKEDLLERLVSRSAALVRLVERFEAAVDDELVEPMGLFELANEVAEGRDRVSVEGDPDIPRVPLNPILAHRILEELIDNGLRFSPEGSPVEVWIDAQGPHIRVKVMDRGHGVPLGDRDRIFEPLEQGEAVDSRTHQGAGMGLSLARAAARAMDGDVDLETSGPGGSTFVWTIPLDREG